MTNFDPSTLSLSDEKLAEASRKVGSDLGVDVESPFSIQWRSKTYIYAARFAGFGSKKGLVVRMMPEIFTLDQCGVLWDAAEQAGCLALNLGPVYRKGNREDFKRLLCQFRWKGVSQAPAWYAYSGLQ